MKLTCAIFGPKKAIGDYRSKDTIHDESLSDQNGVKKDIQLVSEEVQPLNRRKS